MITDEAVLELDAALFGVAEGHRIRGVGNGKDTFGAGGRVLLGQPMPEVTPHPVDGLAENVAVRA